MDERGQTVVSPLLLYMCFTRRPRLILGGQRLSVIVVIEVINVSTGDDGGENLVGLLRNILYLSM